MKLLPIKSVVGIWDSILAFAAKIAACTCGLIAGGSDEGNVVEGCSGFVSEKHKYTFFREIYKIN